MLFDNYVKSLLLYSDVQELPAFLYDKSPAEFYEYMNKVVRYKAQVFESVNRHPVYIIRHGGDCGEKTKCSMMYFSHNGIDFDIVFLKSADNMYHVFCRAYLDGQGVDFDTAQGDLQMGERYPLDEIAVYKVTGVKA